LDAHIILAGHSFVSMHKKLALNNNKKILFQSKYDHIIIRINYCWSLEFLSWFFSAEIITDYYET